ncbi:DEAD/DEAH box helicase [Mycoplasmatota bacterium WC30]
MPFTQLQIIDPIVKSIKTQGYSIPTPIQERAIPILLEKKDIIGSAQTGTGKTAAFAIPILQNITESGRRDGIKALIITPTRELAMQIKASFDGYGSNLPLKTVVIFGGVKQKAQTDRLRKGCDILVATPGRLLDLMHQRIVQLNKVEYFVLDEADRMLDMGFIRDVKKIIARVPEKRQTMLFSATLPSAITNLANSILVDPVRVQITPVETTLDSIKQSLYYVRKEEKIKLLTFILKNREYSSILVFTRTKRNANKVVKILLEKKVSAIAIHGNKSQSARTEALYLFKKGEVRVLVATDLASRGLDIEELSLVVNYSLPDVSETYIHRIGRTGRANKKGIAISFCHDEELGLLKDIEKHIKMKIPVERDHPFDVEISDAHLNNRGPKKQLKYMEPEKKKRNNSNKSKKTSSQPLTDKIKHSQPKKKKEATNSKKRNWTKAKPQKWGSTHTKSSGNRKNYSNKKT